MRYMRKCFAVAFVLVLVCTAFSGCLEQAMMDRIMLGENRCMCGAFFRHALEESQYIIDREIAKYEPNLPQEKAFSVGGYNLTTSKHRTSGYDAKMMRYVNIYCLNAKADMIPLEAATYNFNEYNGQVSAGAVYHNDKLAKFGLRVADDGRALSEIGNAVICDLCSVDGLKASVEESEVKYYAKYVDDSAIPAVTYSITVEDKGEHIDISYNRSESWDKVLTEEVKASIDVDKFYKLMEEKLIESATEGGAEPVSVTMEFEPKFYITDAGEISIYYPRMSINMKDETSSITDVCIHTGKYVKR